MRVAVRELKATLSRVLARAQAGEVIEVSSHNRPIARIVGIPAQGDAGMRQLAANGAITWKGGKPRHTAPLSLSKGGTPVSRMVIEDRR